MLFRLFNSNYKNINLILESGQNKEKQNPEIPTNKENTTYAFTHGIQYTRFIITKLFAKTVFKFSNRKQFWP